MRHVPIDAGRRPEREGLVLSAMPTVRVRDRMIRAGPTVQPDTDILEAARLMHEERLDAVPVTEAGRLVGILTGSDVLRTLVELLRRPAPPGLSPRTFGILPGLSPTGRAHAERY